MSEDNNRLTDHSYDGIQEYDNPMPTWWLATFIGTVIFGSLYWLHYEVAGGPTLQDELNADLEKIEAVHLTNNNTAESEEELLEGLNSREVLANGKIVFQSKCASCHGNELQGIVGPNLVDDYWIHGKGRITEIHNVVVKGIPDKGMPTWENILSPDDLKSVTAFIVSQHGTNPANPKAPQGDKVVNN